MDPIAGHTTAARTKQADTHPVRVVLRVDGGVERVPVVKASGTVLLLQGTPPPVGEPMEFAVESAWLPPKALRGLARAAHVGSPGSGLYALRLMRLASGAGAAPIKDFLRTVCGVDVRDMARGRLERIGHYWWFEAEPQGSLERLPRRHPAELTDQLRALTGDGSDTMYLRLPVTYLVNSVPHAGRAIRISQSSLVIHTNSTLPPLGSLVYVQFSLDCGLVERYAVVRGGVARRADSQRESKRRGRFDLKVYDIEDVERNGVFSRLLERSQGVCAPSVDSAIAPLPEPR